MYRKKQFYTAPTIRFHQWSRKSYAAFASLKRHVTMGCVGKGITEASLGKGNTVSLSAAFELLSGEADKTETDGMCDDSNLAAVMPLLCPITLSVISPTDNAASAVNPQQTLHLFIIMCPDSPFGCTDTKAQPCFLLSETGLCLSVSMPESRQLRPQPFIFHHHGRKTKE